MSEPEWRPLNTAPRDGRRILVALRPKAGHQRPDLVRIARFFENYWKSSDPTGSAWGDDRIEAWLPLPEHPGVANVHELQARVAELEALLAKREAAE